MSGPIVRSGPSATYTENWDQVFGKKKARTKSSTAGKAGKAGKKKAPKKKSSKQ